MAFHSEWLRNNPKGPHGPIPPKGAEGALGSQHLVEARKGRLER